MVGSTVSPYTVDWEEWWAVCHSAPNWAPQTVATPIASMPVRSDATPQGASSDEERAVPPLSPLEMQSSAALSDPYLGCEPLTQWERAMSVVSSNWDPLEPISDFDETESMKDDLDDLMWHLGNPRMTGRWKHSKKVRNIVDTIPEGDQAESSVEHIAKTLWFAPQTNPNLSMGQAASLGQNSDAAQQESPPSGGATASPSSGSMPVLTGVASSSSGRRRMPVLTEVPKGTYNLNHEWINSNVRLRKQRQEEAAASSHFQGNPISRDSRWV